MTSAGIDWQREKWQSGLGSKFIHQGEKNAAKYADEVIVLSKGVQDYFKETYGRETHFIPNGVNLRPTRQSFKHRSSLSGMPLPLLVRKQSRMKIFKTSCRMNTTFLSKPNVGVIAICRRNGTSSYRSVLWEKAAKENGICFGG